jgi:ketosteroid isomerase-like protein
VIGPEERVEFVRRAFEAYNAGDIEAVVDLFDPEVEVRASAELMNPGPYYGRAGYLEWVRQWNEAWETFVIALEEVVPVGQRHVIARVHQTGRGRGSGVDVDMQVGYMFEMREERCVRLALYPSFEAAMAAAREREVLAASETGE